MNYWKKTLLNNEKVFRVRVVSFKTNDGLVVQSTNFTNANGVPTFLIKIKKSLNFETFHLGVRCHVTTLSKPPFRVNEIKRWTFFDEILRYLSTREVDNKMAILHEQIAVMAPQKVGERLLSIPPPSSRDNELHKKNVRKSWRKIKKRILALLVFRDGLGTTKGPVKIYGNTGPANLIRGDKLFSSG